MKVLSLFDGMSCGQIALKKLGVTVDEYYASEIDKYAIQVTQKNFPKTIQVGDVSLLDPNDFQDIDLILAGSPCQGFSFAGKQLAFDDPRSVLFFEFVKLLKAIQPKYFLLENVKMKKEFLEVITEEVSKCYPNFSDGSDLFGNRIEPILINSSLLSAQSRQRYYWTNIPGIKQPEDKGIVLKDILEQDPDEIYQISEAKKDRVLNSKRGKGYFYTESDPKIGTVIAGYHKEPTDGSYIEQHKPVKKTERNRRHLRQPDEKSLCMTATMYKGAGNNGMTLVPQKPKQIGIAVDVNGHDILKRVYSDEGKSPTLNTMGGGNREPKVMVDSYREVRTEEAKKARKEHREKTGKDHTPFRSKELVPRDDGKVGTITPGLNQNHKISLTKQTDQEVYWRKLTPLECERLQTVPDGYTDSVSNTQRYKMLGNGWTVDVVAHILKNMEV
tara:strand:+ start:165 stop:1493 length:1329 start_codon:yes stop_codon:yes gene_type:complete